ncbi:DUF6802 family protein [Rhodococcus sp. TAF43]|uniref:DUF6802 family protein n=1 Tax=unclassified Rhodococcus (in: high G+C Gram-positive bacteria) TaxID=192944 RepID=UPI000E0A7049|nr:MULTISPECIES: DUF6802 family protein [unclassified Rhodococcus (in: high G+C Gram-positive bacteria)]QKT13296.1 hypothetical protein HUN07_23480 [Rhodococcus sp. W8901]RDI18956.1 hypothetical protein DEU38_11953 [Rhodococcus sp. AG1013]
MITTDDVTGNLPDVDLDSFGADSGAVHLTGPAHDIDGDGILDTQTFEVDDAMIVASDLDGDGDADNLTIVGGHGDYSSWEFHRDADGGERWERTDEGTLGA